MARLAGLLLVYIWLLSGVVCADVFRPAYLQLKQLDAETYEVTWKIPALDAQTTLRVKPIFPPQTQEIGPRSSIYVGGVAVQRWQVRVSGGLEGKAVEFADLALTGQDVLVRVERADGTEQLGRILPAESRFAVKPSPGPWEVITTYTVLGVHHILTGFDHLLFVLTLIIITGGGWMLVKTVTAFTVSHSITLAAAALGFVHVPGPPVEAIIALSIVFVAAECIHGLRGRPGITARAPWLVAFTFGLLHGLGFAGALGEVGMPQNHIPLALLFFSVGVETGHFLFVGAVLALIALARRARVSVPQWLELLPPYAIGSVATWWLMQRIAAF